MSLLLKTLNEQRGAKLQEAQIIREKVESEKRGLQDEERNALRVINDQVDKLNSDIGEELRSVAHASSHAPQLSVQEARDVDKFDFAKLLNHLHRSAKGGSTVIDGIEAEMTREGEKEARAAGIQAGGIMLPRMLVRRGETRDMTATGTTTVAGDQGGMTVPTEKRGLLDDFFNASLMSSLGAMRFEGLTGNLDLPRILAGTTPTAKGENVAADEVSPTTAMLSLTPNRLPAYIDISERLLMQSSTVTEAFLSKHLATQLGAVAERAYWHGTGTNEANGIAGTSGIGSVSGGANGLAPTYLNLLDLEEKVDAQNALLGSLHYATNGQIRKKLKGTLENPITTSNDWILKGDIANGYNVGFSNAIARTLSQGTSTNVCSAIFFGNFSDYVMAFWGGLALEMVRDKTNAISGLYTLVANVSYDGGVVRPKSFAAMLDALGA